MLDRDIMRPKAGPKFFLKDGTAFITIPVDASSEVTRKVRDEDKTRFAEQWAAFRKRGKD